MKQTSLYKEHLKLKARMISFANYTMPLLYTSIVAEHLSVRNHAGLFDVSHMGEIIIDGNDALEFIQYISCNDISKLSAGKVKYNCILNKKGGVVDDVLIYCIDSKQFFIVCNAINCDLLYKHFIEIQKETKLNLKIKNEAEEWQQLALQGPNAELILENELGITLKDISYFSFKDFQFDTYKLRISRTGYTGEDGFEIYANAKSILWIWNKLLNKDKPQEKRPSPIGLGARDSLRLEAFYPLYGKELNKHWTPIESNLGWIVKDKVKKYIGYKDIMRHKNNGPPGKIIGFRVAGRGNLARTGYSVWDEIASKKITKVLSATYSPILKESIGSLYLPSKYANLSSVRIEIRDKMLSANLQNSPFIEIKAGKKKKTL